VWAQINENVGIAYGTNIDEATRVVDDVGIAMAADPEWKDRVLEAPAWSASKPSATMA